MKIYKFGGASVKDAEAVRNVAKIITACGEDDLWVVVSAMAKTTNALEVILHHYTEDTGEGPVLMEELKDFHQEVLSDLFPFREHETWKQVGLLFQELNEDLLNLGENRTENYAQIVSYGELLSTRIVSGYLESQGTLNTWVDAREIIKTDARYLEATVDMEQSQTSILRSQDSVRNRASLLTDESLLIITQGFIGHSGTRTTTLGREGSDYTGGILAWSVDAAELSIWKDVPGMLQADPKYYPEAKIIERLSYREAIELAYYGASVIHPKTIKPLQNKGIPLHVRSFMNPSEKGTVIQADEASDRDLPSYIFKQDQVLISVIPHDFSFIMEENISDIFALLAKHGLKANLIQSSAVSFSICIDDKGSAAQDYREDLASDFKVLYNDGLSLLTIRHYNENTVTELLSDREVLVEQRSRQTARFVIKGGFSQSN